MWLIGIVALVGMAILTGVGWWSNGNLTPAMNQNQERSTQLATIRSNIERRRTDLRSRSAGIANPGRFGHESQGVVANSGADGPKKAVAAVDDDTSGFQDF